MLDSIRSFFGASMAPESPEEEVGEEDVRLAACALLIEIAHADDDFTEDERQHLTSAVRRQYGLEDEEAEQLIELAEQARASRRRFVAVHEADQTKLLARSKDGFGRGDVGPGVFGRGAIESRRIPDAQGVPSPQPRAGVPRRRSKKGGGRKGSLRLASRSSRGATHCSPNRRSTY